ncbi:NTP/NDP exchange transporter [Kluyvera sp. STS39-E]|uniref:NTP/NDP exchange transporter n=1 Tax=Kluyvera sp. STS39-E TaxID=3234748 RepID=UPI0034C69857
MKYDVTVFILKKYNFSFLLKNCFHIKDNEVSAVLWSWLYIFSLFLAYYLLRPIRDELGVASGIKNLPWLFSATLIAMLAFNPLFSWAVRKWQRETFIRITYRFFMLHLLAFMLVLSLTSPEQQVWAGRAFFIWLSVFNLFVVSVFWSFVVDVFSGEQGKRLFGLLSTGATLGGISGSLITFSAVELSGRNLLFGLAIVLLEITVFASRKLASTSSDFHSKPESEECHEPVGGGIFSGMTHTLRSPYLLCIAGFMLLYSMSSTFLYFHQASLAEVSFSGSAERIAFFATVDFWVNALTLFVQIFLTASILGRLGVLLTLSILPAVSILSFGALAASPGIATFVVIQVLRRVINFGITRPTREVLFTVVSREERYKSKNFIDTVVYRGGDQVGSWSWLALSTLGLGITGIALLSIPLSVIWLCISLYLGHQQSRLQLISITSKTDHSRFQS